MNSNQRICCLVAGVTLTLMSACASSNIDHSSTKYQPTGQVETIFQVSKVPQSCRVSAHLFVTMPASMTTSAFGERVGEEAKGKGADVILIGQARQSVSESSLDFAYYGPLREYSIRDWSGWSYGLDEWSEQGSWTPLGYNEWIRGDVHYDYPTVMQAAFLRCQK